MEILAQIVKRLKEPSTYAGFAPLLAILGLNAEDPTIKAVYGLLMGLAGVAAIILREKGEG